MAEHGGRGSWRAVPASIIACSSVSLLVIMAYVAGSAAPVATRGRLLSIQLQQPSIWAAKSCSADQPARAAALHMRGRELPPVDAVFLWVNTSDPQWRAASRSLTGGPRPPTSRGEVLLAVASVAHYAPWMRRIWVVSMNQQFNLGLFSEEVRRKITFVDHRDIMPGEYLPTFNSLAIELFLHLIPGLAEHFLYMNDDMLLARPLHQQELFSTTTGNFKSILLPWGLLHTNISDVRPSSFAWMYVNTRLLLESKLGEVPPYGWHAGMFLSQAAYHLAWQLFRPQLNTTASHRARAYRPLEEGGDIMPPLLISLVAIMRGIQEVDTGHTFRMLDGVQPELEHLLAEGRTAGAAAEAALAGTAAEAATAAKSDVTVRGPLAAPSSSSPAAGNNTVGDMARPAVLFFNFQAMNKASPEDLRRWCRLLVQEHQLAFSSKKLGCICASPLAVGMAC